MEMQTFIDFVSRIGAVGFGFLIMAVAWGALRNLLSNELEIVSTGKSAYIKKRFKKYPLTDDDIPGIVENGPGRIVISVTKNRQTMHSTGFDKGGVDVMQVNGVLIINNVDINKFIERVL
jgi:hypothetical protein